MGNRRGRRRKCRPPRIRSAPASPVRAGRRSGAPSSYESTASETCMPPCKPDRLSLHFHQWNRGRPRFVKRRSGRPSGRNAIPLDETGADAPGFQLSARPEPAPSHRPTRPRPSGGIDRLVRRDDPSGRARAPARGLRGRLPASDRLRPAAGSRARPAGKNERPEPGVRPEPGRSVHGSCACAAGGEQGLGRVSDGRRRPLARPRGANPPGPGSREA